LNRCAFRHISQAMHDALVEVDRECRTQVLAIVSCDGEGMRYHHGAKFGRS
jgi:hypothetical protein